MWKKLFDPQSYSLAIVVALVLHLAVIVLFAIEWPEQKRRIAEPTPKNIQAKVIQVENKQAKQRKLDENKRLQQKKLAEQRKAQRKKEDARKKALDKKKAQQDKARKDQLAKNKAKQLADKKAADKKKTEALKKKELLAKKEKELKEKKKQEQKKLEQEAFEQEQQEQLMEALAAEEQQRSLDRALEEEERARKNALITDDIVAQIQAKIYETWRYPPSARPQMLVKVSIQMVPTGEVINVTITKSSGNEAVDRSVIAAVKRAQPLPVPKDNRLFEQRFRNFSMEFSPKDAVW
jgi:colicin import membrane protein